MDWSGAFSAEGTPSLLRGEKAGVRGEMGNESPIVGERLDGTTPIPLPFEGRVKSDRYASERGRTGDFRDPMRITPENLLQDFSAPDSNDWALLGSRARQRLNLKKRLNPLIDANGREFNSKEILTIREFTSRVNPWHRVHSRPFAGSTRCSLRAKLQN
jgi:hypothetical protein